MKKLLLIDANSIIHRSFHALPPFTTPDGRPSGAIYGIASILLKLWRDAGEQPEYMAALFDRPEPTFRDKKYAAYKAQRPATPSDLIAQIIEAHRLFEAFGIKTFEKPGYEADDLIATLAEKFKTEKELQVVILTGDRDTLQLVTGDNVVVRFFNKGISDTTTYDEAAVKTKYGLAPLQIVDYKALVGDSSDNIKGVPGVGPKTGTELLQKFGSVKKLYEHLADDPKADPKLAARLGPFKKEAELSEELVTLERHVPIEVPPLAALAVTPLAVTGTENGTAAAEAQIKAYFESMGFGALIRRMEGRDEPAKKKPVARKEPKDPRSVQGSMF